MKRIWLTILTLAVVSIEPVATFAESEEDGIKRIEALTKSQSYVKATNLYNRMVEVSPSNPQLRLAGAKLFRRMGMYARAMAEYKQLMKSNPNLIEPEIALSQMYMEYLNLPQSLALARQAVSIDGNNKTARIALCQALIASDYLKEASDELSKLQKQANSDPEVNYVSYKLYLKRGVLDKARSELDAAVRAEPSNGQWLLDLSELCKIQGDYSEAQKYLTQALYADPLSVDKLSRMGILQEYFLRDYDQAAQQYKKILEIDPDSVTALAGIDRCKTKKNDLAGMLKAQLRSVFTSIAKALGA